VHPQLYIKKNLEVRQTMSELELGSNCGSNGASSADQYFKHTCCPPLLLGHQDWSTPGFFC